MNLGHKGAAEVEDSLGAQKIRRAVPIVALLNLAYFFVEFAGAVAIGSASLFADSADFLEDTAINLLVFFAVAWPAARNDALANLLIIAAGLLTFVWETAWFDIIVGAIIAAINLSAAKEVWEASREEHDSVEEAFADMDDD